MTKSMFFWQSRGIAEQTRGQVAETLTWGGIDELWVKFADGASWQATFDTGPFPVRGMDDLKNWRDVLGSRGIKLVPWANPRSPGLNESILGLAQFYGAVAQEFGRIELDIEPERYYWRELPQVQHVKPFFRTLREWSGQAKITVDVVGSWGWSHNIGGLVREADESVDGWALQSYWTPAIAAADERKMRDIIGPTKPLDHIAITDHLLEMADWLAPRKRIGVWSFAQMTRPLYSRLQAFDGREGMPSPPPAPPTAEYAVGAGILAAMHARGDEPASDEGEPEVRYAVGKSGRIYTYSPSSNKVAIQEPA